MTSHYTFADYCRAAKVHTPAGAEKVTMAKIPFKHQVEALGFFPKFTRCGDYSEPGTGKTLSMQGYGLWLVLQGNKAVYTMPPTLVPQFAHSLRTNYQDIEKLLSVACLEGTPAQRQKLIENWGDKWPDILITSYRMFVQYHKTMLENGYTFVAVDEANALKTPSSQLHAAVKVFAGNVRRDSNGVLLATGTPIETNVMDCYGLISMITPDRYGSMKNFERVHCNKLPTMPGGRYEKVTSYKNFPLLNQSLLLQARRVKKADVSDLPPRLITEYPIQLSKKHRELYRKIAEERIAEIGDRVLDLTEASALYQGMQRLILSPEEFTDKPVDNAVLETLDTLIEAMQGRKVVVYAWFQNSIDKLKKRYEHLNPAVLYGKTVGSRREKEKQKFIEDPTCQVIFANPRSGGVGVDGFQHVCSHAIFAEVCPFPGVFQQSIDRLHRTGQKSESVNAYVLVPTGTIAVKLRNDLVRKDMQQEMAVLDKRTILLTLMGEEGIRGSLDAIPFHEQLTDDEKLIDIYQEVA